MSKATAPTITLNWCTSSGTAGASGLAIDVPVDLGPVRLVAPLGEGGMGVVWRGRHTLLNRDVAVKFVLTDGKPPCEKHIEIFLEGARAAAQVRHLALTAVLDADLVAGLPYLVMEYVEGPTLAGLLKRGPLSPSAALVVVERIADALAALHASGVLHRDIKPSNILISTDGRPHLTDFGLACLIGSRPFIAGTRGYMAPECLHGEFSARSDLFALAVTGAETLTGRCPAPLSVLESACPEQGDSLLVVRELILRAGRREARLRSKTADQLQDLALRAQTESQRAAGLAELSRRACESMAAASPNANRGPAERLEVTNNKSTLSELATRFMQKRAAKGPQSDASFQIEELDWSKVIAAPIWCPRCGYVLLGVPMLAPCPECNCSSTEILSQHRLVFLDPDWLNRVGRGLRTLFWVLPAFHIVLFWGPSALLPLDPHSEQIPFGPTQLLELSLVVGLSLLYLRGMYRVTLPPPQRRERSWGGVPGLLRILLLLPVLSHLMEYPMLYLPPRLQESMAVEMLVSVPLGLIDLAIAAAAICLIRREPVAPPRNRRVRVTVPVIVVCASLLADFAWGSDFDPLIARLFDVDSTFFLLTDILLTTAPLSLATLSTVAVMWLIHRASRATRAALLYNSSSYRAAIGRERPELTPTDSPAARPLPAQHS